METAFKGIIMELVGGIVFIAWIFIGITAIVVVCTAIEHVKGAIRGRR